jgi:hypothetical protein
MRTEREHGESAATAAKSKTPARKRGRTAAAASTAQTDQSDELPRLPERLKELEAARPGKTVPEQEEAHPAFSASELDAILERLNRGIAAEHVAMDRLLERVLSRAPR